MLYLAQTDTTAGFLSKDFEEINKVKKRALNTPCILTTALFAELLHFVRVPKAHKNLVRKAKKTSFIYPKPLKTMACRVVTLGKHSEFLREVGYLYSSSANIHGEEFDENLAKKTVLENGGKIIDEKFFIRPASRIFKLSRAKKVKIR